MATTINATTPRVTIGGIRAAVVKLNRFWPNTASVRMVAPSVKLKKVAAIEVLGWEPDQGDVQIDVSHSQIVNFAVVRSNPLSVSYASPTTFLTGSLDDIELAGAGIQLEKDRAVNDFDSYPVGGLPADFTQISTAGAWTIEQEAGGNRFLRARSNLGQDRTFASYDVLTSHVDLVVQVKIRFHTVDYSGGGILFRCTGENTTLNAIGLWIRRGSDRLIGRRFTSATTEVWIGDVYSGLTPQVDGHWYYLKGKIEGTNLYGKVWRDDSAEPASWKLVASQTEIPGPGEVGLCGISRAQASGSVTFDDMAFESVPTTYVGSGEWISQRHPLAVVDRYSQSIVSWNQSTPAGTSVVVECQRDVGAPWLTCVSGEPLPGFEFDDGLRMDNLRFRVALATTDQFATPEFSNLQASFIKLDWDLVEISVNGKSAYGRSNQISHWGQKKLIGGVPTITYDDIYAQSQLLFWFDVRASKIPVVFRYDEVDIAGIDWFAAADPFFVSDYLSNWYWVCIEDSKKGEALIDWVVLDTDPKTAGELYWQLIDATPSIQATGWYWVATQIFNEFVSSVLVGEGVLNEFVASLLVNGYRRDEFVQSAVVQGDQLNEFVASLLSAQEVRCEFVSSYLAGELELDEFVASMLVYGVRSDGAIFINLIDDETHQKLLDAGVTFV